MNRRLLIAGLPVCLLLAAPAGAALITTENNNAGQLASALLGPGVTLVNGSAAVSGLSSQTGTFTATSDILPFSGVVLSTGRIGSLVGPRVGSGSSDELGGAGDSDLQAIVSLPTFDAATLTFSFIPTASQVSFQFVFVSSEYPNFITSEFNDVFAFLVNGVNVAVIPGTNPPVPITVRNVHGGRSDAPACGNAVSPTPFAQFFTPNYQVDCTGSIRDINTGGLVGYAIPLFATAMVTPNQVNQIKIAIADTSDEILDSAVFLRAGSFAVGPPPDTEAVPEPSALAMVALGGALFWLRRRA